MLWLAAAAAGQTFTNTAGPMQQARAYATATLLQDGTVLVAGGAEGDNVLASAEVYDPASSTFRGTGSMSRPRAAAQAQLLPDGKVLIMGGEASDGFFHSNTAPLSTDIYDPAKGTFAAGPSLSFALNVVLSARLADGRIFLTGVAGGADCGDQHTCTGPVEIYDPAQGQFTADGALQVPRTVATATALDDGEVLIYGGWSANAAGATSATQTYEIFDPATGTSTLLTSSTVPVFGQAAVKLDDGRVLICGGNSHGVGAVKACEIFDPQTQQVAYTTGALLAGRNQVAATLLSDHRVLVAGGNNQPPDAEIFTPELQTFTAAGNFDTERAYFTATLLDDGSVLIAGGDAPGDGSALASAEVFTAGAAMPDFSLAADNTIATDSTAASVSFKITAAGANGFSGSIALSCTGTGAASCAFAPAGIHAGETSTLTVSGLDLSQNGVLDFQAVGTSGTLSHTLALRIAIEPPLPRLTPATLSFGDETVGQTSATQKVTLSNNGEGTLHISKIATEGDFAETNDCPATLADGVPGCTITVSFRPTAAGARSGALQVSDDGPFSPQSVALSGTGQTTPAPAATLAPAQLDFG
ncbi:MAG: kelch repeat-containing protein, partial [Terriglobales bacterium]